MLKKNYRFIFRVKLTPGQCHWIRLIISQRWLRWWLVAGRQQAITWANQGFLFTQISGHSPIKILKVLNISKLQDNFCIYWCEFCMPLVHLRSECPVTKFGQQKPWPMLTHISVAKLGHQAKMSQWKLVWTLQMHLLSNFPAKAVLFWEASLQTSGKYHCRMIMQPDTSPKLCSHTATASILPQLIIQYHVCWRKRKKSGICFSINSLASGKFEWNFRFVIFKRILVIDGWGISCEIALIWMSLD